MGLCNTCFWNSPVTVVNCPNITEWPGCMYYNNGENRVEHCNDFISSLREKSCGGGLAGTVMRFIKKFFRMPENGLRTAELVAAMSNNSTVKTTGQPHGQNVVREQRRAA